MTFSFVAFASGEFFEAMEIVDGNCAPFSTADLLYVHCIDSNVQFEYSLSGVASQPNKRAWTREFPVRSSLKTACVVSLHKGNQGLLRKLEIPDCL